MYKHIPEFGDEEGHPIWESGIAGIVSQAKKFCQPQWHGFDVWADVSDMYQMSLAAQKFEDRFNAELKVEAEESDGSYKATRGNSTRLMCGMRSAALSDLPNPYRDCISEAEGDPEAGPFSGFADNPLVVMALAAQALATADDAAEQFTLGNSLTALQRIDRAAVSLAHAAEFSGFQQAERGARKVAADLRAKRSADGGRARADRYAPTKKWVLDRYLERSWASPRQAALSLFQEALELSRQVGAPLSEDRAFTTVYNWILSSREIV